MEIGNDNRFMSQYKKHQIDRQNKYRPLAEMTKRCHKPPDLMSNREIELFLKEKGWLPGTPEYRTIRDFYRENVPFPRYIFTRLEMMHSFQDAA